MDIYRWWYLLWYLQVPLLLVYSWFINYNYITTFGNWQWVEISSHCHNLKWIKLKGLHGFSAGTQLTPTGPVLLTVGVKHNSRLKTKRFGIKSTATACCGQFTTPFHFSSLCVYNFASSTLADWPTTAQATVIHGPVVPHTVQCLSGNRAICRQTGHPHPQLVDSERATSAGL